ncbi:sulfite exporter TauE/SafE family protein [Methylobacterium durans]|uniref:sulfite exporter TauE/SafE family protein n=1 Tax=Methylobacterium durans TaxID=2202825 RepID=UPI002AFE8FE2|nr:sulfite exporter TauE/SafE family protein [Methylobacterium durans]MEA1834948.1 sulfite exporter TauE/SafE family protein [Methylobacterium durans]
MLTASTSVVLTGALAGGFVSGLAGFGTGLVALGIWLYVLDPASAATLVVLCSVVSQAQTIPAIWHAIDRARVWPMLAAGLLGVPLGTSLLAYLDPDAFRLGMGILLLGFSTFMLLGRFRPQIGWGGRIADSVVGFSGGILGGLAGLSGPLPTIWATVRGWSKDERRGVFQAYNLTVLGGALMWHAASGLLTAELVRLAALALPGTILGAWLGGSTYRRLSDQRFHEVVLTLLGVSGLILVWSRL